MGSPGPNPWKPVMILEELGLPIEYKLLFWEELMTPEFAKINPGGKVPVMYDPNTDLTLWESGAIILYLIEQYDTEKKLTYTSLKEKNLLNQWLMFQMSQQGPFFGQIGWFNYFHPDKVPSVIERYSKQSERILNVLNGALEGKDWLVGDKCTYADLSFFMWNVILPLSVQSPPGETPLSKYPNVMAWHNRMAAMESVKKTIATRQKMMDEEGMGADALPKDTNAEEMLQKMKDNGAA
ncbi:glutathione transferase protein [Rutstroemia sp. NJR-2017a BVV2]|nr:glutathione transferase protein [Rutstroemia sp. NJR-2017a BVV2]